MQDQSPHTPPVQPSHNVGSSAEGCGFATPESEMGASEPLSTPRPLQRAWESLLKAEVEQAKEVYGSAAVVYDHPASTVREETQRSRVCTDKPLANACPIS